MVRKVEPAPLLAPLPDHTDVFLQCSTSPCPQAPLLNSRKARLRVVILNVRGWVSAHGHSSVKAVAGLCCMDVVTCQAVVGG